MLSGIQFDSWAAFVDMGGYAFNVWSVYGLFIVFIAINLVQPLRRRKTLLRDLHRRHVLSARFESQAPQSNSPKTVTNVSDSGENP